MSAQNKADKNGWNGASLVPLWWRLHLPMLPSSIPGHGAKIPHGSQPRNQNIKPKQYCNKFKKDFENGLPKKKKNLLKKWMDWNAHWRFKVSDAPFVFVHKYISLGCKLDFLKCWTGGYFKPNYVINILPSPSFSLWLAMSLNEFYFPTTATDRVLWDLIIL